MAALVKRITVNDIRGMKQNGEKIRGDRFLCARMQHRGRCHGAIGINVVPKFRQIVLAEIETGFL